MAKKKIKKLVKKTYKQYKPMKKIKKVYSEKGVIARAGARLKKLFLKKKYTNPKRLKKGLTEEQKAQFSQRGKK